MGVAKRCRKFFNGRIGKQLLSDWGLIEVVNAESIGDIAPLNQIKVLSFKEKDEWTLETKYNIGKKKTTETK